MGKLEKYKYLILVLLLALLIRLIALSQSFWLDEAIGLIAVTKFNYWDLLTQFMPADNHPPLYYLMLKLWTSLFGSSEFTVRLLSISFCLLAIVYTYKFAQVISKSKFVTYFSILFLATSQFYVYYSQEARMYPLTSFFATFALYYLTQAIHNPKYLKNWLNYSLAITALLFTDYLPVFFMFGIFAYVYLHRPTKEIWKKLIMSYFPLILLGLFWLPIFYQQIQNGQKLLIAFPQWQTVAGGASIKNMLLLWIKFTLGRISFENKKIYFSIVGIVSLIYLPILLKFFKFKKLLSLLVVSILTTLFFSFFFPGFNYFRFVYIFPLFALLISVSINELNNKNKYLVTTLLLILNISSLSYYFINQSQQRENWKKSVEFIENRGNFESVVLFAYSDVPAGYQWYSKGRVDAYGAANAMSADSKMTTNRTLSLIKNKEIVYYFEYLRDLSDPGRVVENTLKREGYSVTETYGQFSGGIGQIFKWEKI